MQREQKCAYISNLHLTFLRHLLASLNVLHETTRTDCAHTCEAYSVHMYVPNLIPALLCICAQNDMGSVRTDNGARFFTTYMKARIFCEREVPSESNTKYVGAIDYQYNVMSMSLV